jgi:hypothetical protein
VNCLIKTTSFAAAALFVSQAFAAPTTCAANGSFANLIATNAAGGCYVQDQLFSGFTYLSSAGGPGAVPVSVNSFFYTAVANAPDAVGFDFGFTLTALPGMAGNISLGWLVQGVNILSNHIVLAAATSGNAVAIAETTYCKGGPVAGCPVALIDQLEAYRGSGLNSQMTDAKFFSPVQKLGVRTTLNVFAGPGGSATITSLRQTVDPPVAVPEPASIALTGGGFISLYFIISRRRCR